MQHGYNKSEMAPYLYEEEAFSTTIALRGEHGRLSNSYRGLSLIRGNKQRKLMAIDLYVVMPFIPRNTDNVGIV
ncbi:hypothetical protein IVB22_39060 [Bradyrhizobium sp. 190]|uniref:hypothetical protein n=1 Tax=Bradyrhizobium sp. 190 TaxID=2782658 RepID=UPI001FF7A6E5|nr:hypothetical protein [Bradyrhizobium sp. 190]MCK1518374.1 hypothetical protein [Bradyrhizobium sp. 190]